MPIGINAAWRRFLRAEIADITSGADVVLHQGDQVEGRWGQDCDGRGVFGPVETWSDQVRALTLAGNIYYSAMKRRWRGHDVLFGMGDHEIGDVGLSGIVLPGTFTYQAHRYWKAVWRRHYGPSRYASRRGDVGIITLNPIMKTSSGIIARIRRSGLDAGQDRSLAKERRPMVPRPIGNPSDRPQPAEWDLGSSASKRRQRMAPIREDGSGRLSGR